MFSGVGLGQRRSIRSGYEFNVFQTHTPLKLRSRKGISYECGGKQADVRQTGHTKYFLTISRDRLAGAAASFPELV